MSAMSNYVEQKNADLFLRGQAVTPPTSLQVALYVTTPPGEDGAGGTEASYTNYARVTLNALSGQFNTPGTDGLSQNQNAINFPQVGGATSQTVTHWAIWDGATLLFVGALTASKTLDPGDIPSFPAGSLKITFA